jgi:hypothetical protein
MKMRNGANNAWITLYQLDGEWSTIAFENGTAAAPSIYFKDSGTDTGIYSPGADQVGISTGGTARIVVDASGNVNIDSNTFYVDAANNRVGVGTTGPSYTADVAGTFRSTGIARLGTAETTTLAYIGNPDTAGNKYIFFSRASALTDIVNIQGIDAGVGTANIALQASGGNVGIGTLTPNSNGLVTIYESSGAKLYLSDGQLGLTYGARLTGGGIGGDGSYAELGVVDSNTYNKAITVTSQANNIIFGKGATEKARIDPSGRLLVGGSADSGGALLQVFGDRIRIGTAKTPASATATGTTGEIAWDADYIYVCTATNTWKRVAISTW